MSRTCLRPIPTGKIEKKDALLFGVALSFISVFGLYYFSNLISASLLLLTIVFYVFVYTVWLKRKTPQNCNWWGFWRLTTCNRLDNCNKFTNI